jgi:hypothetical protein
LFGLFGKPSGRFASRCSGFGHGRLGKSPLVHGPCVSHKFRKARVASNRSDLVCGATGLCQAPSRSLAQPVGGTMRQSGRIALFPEPTAKCRSLKRSTVPGGNKRQMIARRSRNDRR